MQKMLHGLSIGQGLKIEYVEKNCIAHRNSSKFLFVTRWYLDFLIGNQKRKKKTTLSASVWFIIDTTMWYQGHIKWAICSLFCGWLLSFFFAFQVCIFELFTHTHTHKTIRVKAKLFFVHIEISIQFTAHHCCNHFHASDHVAIQKVGSFINVVHNVSHHALAAVTIEGCK